MQIGHSGRKGSTQVGWEQMDHPLGEGQLAARRAVADSVHERCFPDTAGDDARRHAANTRRVRPLYGAGQRGRLRHARAAHGARLPARELHLAADECAQRRVRRIDRQPDALPARSVSRLPRRVAAGQADVGADLGDRLGAGRPARRGSRCARADAEGRRLRPDRRLRPARRCRSSGRSTGACSRRRSPTGLRNESASRR
jgi:hypothetical protein